ncbi:hypothetical protein UlMin_009945 [Ulmus minor]
MDLAIHVSKALSPSTNPENTLFRTSLHSSDTSFPIIAIAIIGILATGFLLVSYYIFVIKCCLNWHRIDLLRRFSLSRNRRHEEMLMAVFSPGIETRGLEESVIRSIPILKFKKDGNSGFGGKLFSECAVCLNEFQEEEKLRIIPNCCHIFHIDCIDVWLQGNANCPLCRTSISTNQRFQIDQIIAPSSSPMDPSPYGGSLIGGDEDYVVIELGNDISEDQNLFGRRERLASGQVSVRSISPSPRKLLAKKGRKFQKITSMGDECIDIRNKDEQFSIQPIRRSFSMDSSADRQMFLAIQEAVLQQNRQVSEVSPIEGCSSRVRRSFFSFGHGRGSKSSVLPIYLEP